VHGMMLLIVPGSKAKCRVASMKRLLRCLPASLAMSTVLVKSSWAAAILKNNTRLLFSMCQYVSVRSNKLLRGVKRSKKSRGQKSREVKKVKRLKKSRS